jgi:hypothetical protein
VEHDWVVGDVGARFARTLPRPNPVAASITAGLLPSAAARRKMQPDRVPGGIVTSTKRLVKNGRSPGSAVPLAPPGEPADRSAVSAAVI